MNFRTQHTDLLQSWHVARCQPGENAMKLTAILLALPLVIGSGAAMAADSTTTTESSSTMNAGMPSSTNSEKTVERHSGLLGDKTVETDKSTTQNMDGSATTQKSKTFTKE
jgi:hypothetical protein